MTTRMRRFAASLALVMLVLPMTAHAQNPPPLPPPLSINTCSQDPANTKPWAFTEKVVKCVVKVVTDATEEMLKEISRYMVNTVSIMMLFAIMVFGMHILTGEDELRKKSAGFLLRLGLVGAFSYMLGNETLWQNLDYEGGMIGLIFAVEDQLISMVLGGYSPWEQIDSLLGRLMGFGPQIALFHGLLGVLGAALFSSTTGILLFLAGISALINFIMFILRVVFIYLTVIVSIAFLLIISPIIIPMALFFHTERYFKKWVDMIIANLLVPVMLFAFLSLCMAIFILMVDDIFVVLGSRTCHEFFTEEPCQCQPVTSCAISDTEGACCIHDPPDLRAHWKLNQPLFSWLMPADPSSAQDLEQVTRAAKVGSPAVQPFIAPTMRRSMNASILNMAGIDFGPNNVGIMQQLVFALVSLWIFASLMKSLVDKIPEVANDIARTFTGITMQPMNIEKQMQRTVQRAKHRLSNAAGAGAGGRAGGARDVAPAATDTVAGVGGRSGGTR